MREMYVAFHPNYKEYEFLCMYEKETDHFPVIVSELGCGTELKRWIGHLVSNPRYEIRKATQRDIAKGLAKRI